jgi:hypothetical protein
MNAFLDNTPDRSPNRSPINVKINTSASILRYSGDLDQGTYVETKERQSSDCDNILMNNQSVKVISIENENGV